VRTERPPTLLSSLGGAGEVTGNHSIYVLFCSLARDVNCDLGEHFGDGRRRKAILLMASSEVAHALLRAVSRLLATPVRCGAGVDKSVDAARTGARATKPHRGGQRPRALPDACLTRSGKAPPVRTGSIQDQRYRRDSLLRNRKRPQRTSPRRSCMKRFDNQNVNVSSSAIKITGGPPEEIFTALAKVCLPPADSAHFWSASMDGKCTSAIR
jgi:hypothetical protein